MTMPCYCLSVLIEEGEVMERVEGLKGGLKKGREGSLDWKGRGFKYLCRRGLK